MHKKEESKMGIAVIDMKKQKTVEMAFGSVVIKFVIPESGCTFCERKARWFIPEVPPLFLCERCERKSGYRRVVVRRRRFALARRCSKRKEGMKKK